MSARQLVFAASGADTSLDLNFLTGALDPRITFTRADTTPVASYFDSTGTMRFASVNAIRNSTMVGASPGTPGTLPNNWAGGGAAGLTVNVIGIGTENGISYVDIQWVGTSTGTSVNLPFEATSFVAAVQNQTWTLSFYQRLVGGSLANVTTTFSETFELNSGGSLLTVPQVAVAPATGAALSSQRVSGSFTLPSATAAFIRPILQFSIVNGVAINFTLRIGAPQLELGPTATQYIPTSSTASGGPRFDYDPVTHAAKGLLIEEARTNSITQSGNIAAAPWLTSAAGSPAAPVVTGTNALAPDGTLTAARVVMPAVTAGANASFVYQSAGNGTVPTAFSLWLRGAVGGEVVNFATTNFAVWFHSTAILTTAWQRFSVVATPPSANCAFQIGTDMRDATQTTNGAQTFYVWGVQAEAGAFTTSYIPTAAAAAVTRAADVATMPAGSWFNAAAGTLTGEGSSQPKIGAANANLYELDDGAGAVNIVGDIFHQTDNQAIFRVRANNVPVFTSNFGTLAPGVNWKTAVTYSSGYNAAVLNGGTVASNVVTFSLTATPTTLRLGSDQGGNSQLNGYIRRVRYWPRALSGPELQQATS